MTPTPKPGRILTGPMMPLIEEQADQLFTVHRLAKAKDRNALIAEIAPRIRAIATAGHFPVNGALMEKLPKLEIVANFGVGYDSVDVKWAGEHGIVVTNTPDVLNDEVADTALGLLLCTVRELPQAERHLRAGKWTSGDYRLTASLRGRRAGIVGLGRIGKAIARRLRTLRPA